MRTLARAGTLLCLMVGVAAGDLVAAAAAQDSPLPFKTEPVGTYQSGPVGVQGAFSGTPVVVDLAFTTTHENVAPAAPFTVIVPRVDDIRFLAGGKKTGAPELVKLTLPTKDGKQAVEILRLVNLFMPQGPAPTRLTEAARLLREVGVAQTTRGYEQVKLLDLYATKIGGYDAVSLHLDMTSPRSGEVYLVKLAAILHPTKANGVLAFLMANNTLSDVRTADDLRSKGVGMRIIHSLKFHER